MVGDHLLIFITWLVYYAIHSLLAMDSLKRKWLSYGFQLNHWRILYSLISVLGLLIIGYQILTIPSTYFYEPGTVSRFFAMVFATYGVIVIRVAFRNYSVQSFLTRDDRFDDDNDLKVSGANAKVRHPLYSGTILIFIGMFLFVPKLSVLISAIITIVYVLIAIPLEEGKLIKKYGDKYRKYKTKVPALIPKINIGF